MPPSDRRSVLRAGKPDAGVLIAGRQRPRYQGRKMAFASKLDMIARTAPGILKADLCSSSDICTYNITATGLDTSPTQDTDVTWNLMFQSAGPELFNAASNTLLNFKVAGSLAAGWVYDNALSGLFSYGSDGAAIVSFDDTKSATDGLGIAGVMYTFYATNAFWASTVNNIAFGATSDRATNSGSFFTLTTDPPCTGFTVSISAVPAVPEAATGILLGALAGVALYLVRKRRNHAA